MIPIYVCFDGHCYYYALLCTVMLVFAAPKNKAMSSYFSIQFLLFNLHFGFWDAYNPYLHEMGKNLQHLFKENCLVQPYIKFFLGDDFSPSVVIIRLVLHFFDPLYKSCLQIKSKFRFSLVHYFWSLASNIFLFLVMVTCLLLY